MFQLIILNILLELNNNLGLILLTYMGFEMDIEEGEECELKIVNGLLKSLGIDCELVM